MDVCLPLPSKGQYQNQWDYVLSNLGIGSPVWVIGDVENAPRTNMFAKLNATYIDDASFLPETQPLVLLAADNGRIYQGDKNLVTFVHPPRAIYMFGGDTEWLTEGEMGGREPDHIVFINTDTHDDMWSWVTYAVVAWDRMMKNG